MQAHRQALWPLYLPSLLLGIPAQSALVLLPLYVLDLGGSAAQAAAVVGFRGLGMMALDLPAGLLAARIGDKALMALASAALVLAFFCYALIDTVAWFYVVAFLHGCGSASFLLGRMAYLSDTLPVSVRGRVIAMLAGSQRLAALIGPLAGGAVAAGWGFPTAFVVGGVLMAGGLVLILFAARPGPRSQETLQWHALPALAVEYQRVFLTAGVAAISFMLMRAGRTVLIPLAGAAAGLDAQSIGALVSLSAIVDVALFYPAGVMMDRFGRRATAVPSAFLFSAALAALAWLDGPQGLLVVAVALGVANGLSTGIVMTLGTDHAPPSRRGEFLGLWRLLTDLGSAAGPMLISAVVVSAPLSVAALAIAGVGACGSLVVYRYVEETLQR